MEVAFWELAPYFVNAEPSKLEEMKIKWIQDNAGKAFEFMLEACEKKRADAKLKSIEEVRKTKTEDAKTVEVVNTARKRFNLCPLHECKFPSLLVQQKEETVTALGVLTEPCDGIKKVFDELKESKIPFCICTTSGKPRVPVCVKTLGFENYFPPYKIHSGESDFTPSRFKPEPDVYLKGARTENYDPMDCVAVEDSTSGVGSAANAKVGFIIGYVGASHIPKERKESHAKDLLSGRKSKDGRGANVVIEDMTDATAIMKYFLAEREAGRKVPGGKIHESAIKAIKGKYYVSEVCTGN
eukprot:CAMPEP_0184504332 /NCGR_PEP_ID=MMETSP0113_2-20130426/52410_1 /TAXON_ID=91329 /ORGANISM="Norrisiella sphaerica, Strain BC52" /LENGTH=297 /DNA_ID=CAMNT_0026893973 /DNA_START=225 /DNA_END=1118 /DNA_ORIENTATION=+